MKQACRTFSRDPYSAPAGGATAGRRAGRRSRWFGNVYTTHGDARLRHPDSDYVMFYFSCRPGATVVKFGLQDEESDAGEGGHGGSEPRDQRDTCRVFRQGDDQSGPGSIGFMPTCRWTGAAAYSPGRNAGGHIGAHPLRKRRRDRERGRQMFATCDSPKPASDRRDGDEQASGHCRVAYSEAGVDPTAMPSVMGTGAGASRTFTIPGGRDICTFDLPRPLPKTTTRTLRHPTPAGTRICVKTAFVVHD